MVGAPSEARRTFSSATFRGRVQSTASRQPSTVPTAAQRQGIFTQAVYDPATTRRDAQGRFVRDAFPNNRLPLSRVDPAALSLLERYPLPNLPGAANNYRRVANERTNQDQFDVRIDHKFTERDQLFGRYSFFTDTSTPVTPLPDGSGLITAGV